MDIRRRIKVKRFWIFGILLGICVTAASLYYFFQAEKKEAEGGVAECAKGNWEEGKKRAGHRMQGMQGEYRGNSKTNTKGRGGRLKALRGAEVRGGRGEEDFCRGNCLTESGCKTKKIQLSLQKRRGRNFQKSDNQRKVLYERIKEIISLLAHMSEKSLDS